MKPHKAEPKDSAYAKNASGILTHKHDWHCGEVYINPFDHTFILRELNRWDITSVWACSICGAVKELKSKEVVKE